MEYTGLDTFTRDWTLFLDRYGSVQLDEEHNVT